MLVLNEKMAEIYNWLDQQIEANCSRSMCKVCGSCCSYQQYGHRIYITSPEIMYLQNALKSGQIRQPGSKVQGRCAFLSAGRCSISDYRFGPCRIFYCNSDAMWQNLLSEQFLARIKSLCNETSIEYRYIDMGEPLTKFCD